MGALAHSLELARVDLVRGVRKNTDWDRGASPVVSVVMYALLVGAASLGGGYGASRLGELLAEGDTGTLAVGSFTAMEALRGLLALFWLLVVVILAVRAVGQRGTLAQPEGVLTVVPTREALVGVLLAEYAYYLLWTLVPATGIGVGLAAGAGVVWPALAVPAAVAAAGAAAVPVGYVLGLSVRHVATRLAFVARNKGAIIVVVFVAYFGALSTGALDRLLVGLFEPMGRSPVGWYADLLALGTPALGAATANAAAAVGLTAVLAAVAAVAGTAVAERHWFSDPVLAGEPERASAADAPAPGLDRRLAPVLGTATASLVVLSWRRAARSPLKLLYALYPLLLLVGVFADVVQSGRVPTYLPYATLLFVAWAAGVVFTLNPLGDQGAALAATLLSAVDGRQFVRAHLVAGLVVAVPLGVAATAAVALASPVDEETALVLTLAAPVVTVVSAALSVGVGMAFPKFEATSVTRSMKTVLPSLWAFVLFSLYLFATAAAAVLVSESAAREFGAAFLTWLLPFGLGVSAGTLYWVGAVALVPLLAGPVAAYRYAVDRFDRYTLS